MKIVINNIKMPLRHSTEDAYVAAQEIVRSNSISARNFEIYKQSIDARRKNNIHYVYSVIADTDDKIKETKDICILKDSVNLSIPKVTLKDRPVVVGLGPCGLFAAYILALSGNPPLILERGEKVEDREKSIENFWKTGILNVNSNIQFGEGGAGTFSDGKLTTRISDPRQRFVLKTLVDFGAPEDIMFKAKPHVGTDVLKTVIKNMRKELISLGCEIRFNSCVTNIEIKNGKVCGIEINHDKTLPCKTLLLAIGHSSRDTYENLNRLGVALEPKPFAIGVRIEHSQSFIDSLQYGNVKGLPPADYRVAYNGKDRSCYSFCMCPGGEVVNASSEEGMLCVNGMSNHSRDGQNANSALVVTVKPSDFDKGNLGGMELQRKYETLAYKVGGENKAPLQLAEDFVKDVPSTQLKDVTPTIKSGFNLAEIKNCLPEYVCSTLREGLMDFEHKMSGFSSNGATLTGVETRTSAPVKILRDEFCQSANIEGLYPCGEGAGFAGGIVSAAVDGIRASSFILEK